jgi:hypothetical protein
MKAKNSSKWVILTVACFVILGTHTLVKACQKTTTQQIITYSPAGSDCVDGKTKRVCTGTTCATAGTGESGSECCTNSTTTTSCSKYIGHDPWYESCHWDDAGTEPGTTPSANLSGNGCTG